MVVVSALLFARSARADEPATVPTSAPSVDPSGATPTAPARPAASPEPSSSTSRLAWDPSWPKFQTFEFILTGAQIGLAFGSLAIPGTPRWTERNGFDESIRNALRATTYEGYQRAKDASDLGLVALINLRLVDDLFVAWWAHDKGSVAYQLALIDIETLSFTAALNGIIAGVVGRERPYVRRLCKEENDESDCDGSKQYRSFYSGHASTSFALAGLTCIHHANLPLYQHPVADGAACVVAVGGAATVATMRVVADQHYASDVLTGAAMGMAAGLGIPWLLHYSGGAEIDASGAERPPSVRMSAMPYPGGAMLMGTW